MNLFDLFRAQPEAEAVEIQPISMSNTEKTYSSEMGFSTPMFEISADKNLTTPYIDDTIISPLGFVYLDWDNLYSQRVNTLYYKCPANQSAINFKVQSTVGGGFEYDIKDERERARVTVFDSMFKINKLVPGLCLDMVMHEACYVRVKFKVNDGSFVTYSMKRIPREQVRNDIDGLVRFVNKDWSRSTNGERIRIYDGTFTDEERKVGSAERIVMHENYSPGSDVYPLPKYSSCLGWAFVDGEMSELHKHNITQSIFPSAVFSYPREPRNAEEKQKFVDAMKPLKGAKGAGKVILLFAKAEALMPKITSFTPSQNDKLFEQTDDRIDAQVYKAHMIDPIIMGIRPPGKLGGGAEVKTAYTIYEKNQVKPRRTDLEDFVNGLLFMFGIRSSKFVIRNYQLIEDEIVEVDDSESTRILSALNSMSPLVATKALEFMSPEQVLALLGTKPDDEFLRSKREKIE